MDATRNRLLMAAGEIFAEKGFDKATVREICQAAQVQNIAAVNYYFGDKERLYVESVKHAHQVQIDEIPLPNWQANTPPAEKLRGFVHTMVARLTGDSWLPWQEHLMMREVANPTSAVVELVQQFIRPHFELLLSIIDEIIPSSVTTVQRHQIAFSIIGQCLHYKVARHIVKLLVGTDEAATYTPEQLAEHIYSFSLAALRDLPATKPQTTRRDSKSAGRRQKSSKRTAS
jgi:TetR/AcrR family transcriptional regulator, regulator of cefoperazone and chloramphenicol sensitivity